MNRIKFILDIGVVFVLALYAIPAAAFTVRNGAQASVAKDETIEGNLVISGQAVTVDGNVTGDVICAGQTISITGVVGGDVICAGQTLKISSEVGGSVRAAGQTIDMAGKVKRNATVAAQTASFNSETAGELFFASQSAVVGGRVAGDIAGAAGSITIDGNIGGNAQLRDGSLNIKNSAVIGGALSYTSANDTMIDPGAKIGGGARRYEPPAKEEIPMEKAKKSVPEIVLGMVVKLIFYLLFALLFAQMFSRAVIKTVDEMLAKPGRTVGTGFLFLFLVPVVSILMMLTIIGIPVAMVALLFFAPAMFLAMLLAAVAAGRQAVRMYLKNRQESLAAQTVVGTVIWWLLFEIPFLNIIAILGALAWGLGGVYRMFRGDGRQA